MSKYGIAALWIKGQGEPGFNKPFIQFRPSPAAVGHIVDIFRDLLGRHRLLFQRGSDGAHNFVHFLNDFRDDLYLVDGGFARGLDGGDFLADVFRRYIGLTGQLAQFDKLFFITA